MQRLACLLLGLTLWPTGNRVHGGEGVDFGRDIKPLLAGRCVRCHGPKKQEGGLRLDFRRPALQGSDSGRAIVAGKPAESELLRRINAEEDKRMPPSGPPLSAEQKALLRRWIEQGAVWPDALAGQESSTTHWAFQPIRRPAVRNRELVKNPIDAFLLARLAAKGLTFSPAANKATLLRRLHLDLVGLPPSPKEIEAFLQDSRPDAYAKEVDRLLASPHFGERWGRHWLDLARFAESDGYENDNLRPDAWRFRDWVVDAINRDVPFDEFTVQQLAGDLLAAAFPKTGKGDAGVSLKIAAGFHRHTLWNSAASADKEEFRTLAIKDRVDTTAAAWMGLTVGCAKCHSHKYDPISQREYYQLYAFFNNTDHVDVPVPGGKAMTLVAKQRPTFVHKRGNFQQKGEQVNPGTPAFLPPLSSAKQTADRLDLARWLVEPRHPLTARVAVNRFWQHLFGAGLVATPENFGVNGQPPEHPELLDWLASEFTSPVTDGARRPWSRKSMIRTIVLSAAYQQSSHLPRGKNGDPEGPIDPANSLFGRQNRFRVEAETIRDLALASSGLLDLKLGGPSIVPPYPDGLLAQKFSAEALRMPTKDHHRRGIYIHVQRTLSHPMLAVFDVADGNQPCLRRDRSVTPMQALTLLNDPVYTECAQALGGRLRKAGGDVDARIRYGFQLCLGRSPSARELGVIVDLVAAQKKLGASDEAIWAGVARTLLNTEEFITRE